MAELQPPAEPHVNGGVAATATATTTATTTTTAAFPTVTLPTEPPAGPAKRQRRPSVRLGEIGDQHTYENHHRRTTKQQQNHQWKYTSSSKDPKASNNKTRHLTNLSSSSPAMEFHETLDRGPEDKINHNTGIGSWKVRDSSKSKRGISTAKRSRSNWSSKADDGDERFEKFEEEEEEVDYDDVNDVDDDDGYRDFDREGSAELNYGSRSRDGVRVRVSDGVELDGVSDADARINWNNSDLERNGVRVWLNQLGLGRYFPIFEVHEVDDEVLPLLTLEDLKDMGINAVGSRRKMFCSIQKLGKGFS